MTTQEVADKLVAFCREGKNLDAIDSLYGDNIVSIEPAGAPQELTEGKGAVRGKTVGFFDMVKEMHSAYCSDPVVAGDHFSVAMGMDITMKDDNRMQMDEVGVYQVKEGQIVKETFHFNTGQ